MIVHCVFSPLGAFALSLQCRALPTEAAVVVPWAVWLGSPILQGLAFAVVQVWHQVRRLCSFFAFFTAQFRSVSVGCVSFALADVADQAWDSSLMTRMIIWLVGSGASHHMVPDQDLLHNFVPFDTQPRINTAKAGQFSFAIWVWRCSPTASNVSRGTQDCSAWGLVRPWSFQ